jgi:hypothetical protein
MLTAQSAEMPGWVVPVLRLVSATHVEPTTGVVLSADGLVLVPADFASPGDEIIVLDGGTDIVRNGRPARLEKGFPEFGLKVLRVNGLRRQGAPLAAASPADNAKLTLRAFPPAEQIAEGVAPLNVTTTIRIAAESETPILSADAALPNVTGALLDECGNLVGISLAEGIQSLSAEEVTQYRWGAALSSVMDDLELPVTGSDCSGSSAEDLAPEPVPEPGIPEQPEVSASEAPAPDPSDPVTEEPAELEIDEPEAAGEELPPIEIEAEDQEPEAALPSGESAPAVWPWLVAALLLLAGGVLVLRARRGARQPSPPPGDGVGADAGPDRVASEAESAEGWLAPPPDSRLVLRGSLANGRPVKTSVAVSANAINVEIGRGDCELVIESASVSRRHARLNGTSEALTLTDLGSSNGTSINGVPCLEGEIMYLEPGDTVILGDARFTLSIEAAPANGKDR